LLIPEAGLAVEEALGGERAQVHGIIAGAAGQAHCRGSERSDASVDDGPDPHAERDQDPKDRKRRNLSRAAGE
jgi:hypothetical protein